MINVCFFELSEEAFEFSDQAFDVACNPWKSIGFVSYTFIGMDFSAAEKMASVMSLISWSILS